jgi:hypothetical protein
MAIFYRQRIILIVFLIPTLKMQLLMWDYFVRKRELKTKKI